MRNLETTMGNKVQQQPSQTKPRFKAGDVITNWRLGGDDIHLSVMGVTPRGYLVKVLKSPEFYVQKQYWTDSGVVDILYDTYEEVLEWKKELDLD